MSLAPLPCLTSLSDSSIFWASFSQYAPCTGYWIRTSITTSCTSSPWHCMLSFSWENFKLKRYSAYGGLMTLKSSKMLLTGKVMPKLLETVLKVDALNPQSQSPAQPTTNQQRISSRQGANYRCVQTSHPQNQTSTFEQSQTRALITSINLKKLKSWFSILWSQCAPPCLQLTGLLVLTPLPAHS